MPPRSRRVLSAENNSRAAFSRATLLRPDRISWATGELLASKESSKVTQEPRILRTRARARLPRCRLINRRSRVATGHSALLLLHLPFLRLRSLFRATKTRERTAEAIATAMAQSRCPLAKLKYLAFGRARKRLQRTEICDFASRTRLARRLARESIARQRTKGLTQQHVLSRHAEQISHGGKGYRARSSARFHGSRVSRGSTRNEETRQPRA